MTAIEAYERACALWGDGVAWQLSDRCVVGVWIEVSGLRQNGDPRVLLKGRKVGCHVKGEGATWEEAFERAEHSPVGPR